MIFLFVADRQYFTLHIMHSMQTEIAAIRSTEVNKSRILKDCVGFVLSAERKVIGAIMWLYLLRLLLFID